MAVMTCLGSSSRARNGSPTVSRTSSAKRSGQTVCWPASQPSRESSAIALQAVFEPAVASLSQAALPQRALLADGLARLTQR